MPNEADIVVPNGDPSTGNPGLMDALTSWTYNLDTFFSEFPNTVDNFWVPGHAQQPDYITKTAQVYSKTYASGATVTMADLEVNAVNELLCNGKGITIDDIITDVVLVTDCEVKFNAGAALENATLANKHTGSKSVNAPSGFRIGASTYCNDGKRGASVFTLGGLTTSSGMEAYGATVVSQGDINFTANADGMGGIMFISGGRIDLTSNGNMGFCDFGPPTPSEIPVFKMVM